MRMLSKRERRQTKSKTKTAQHDGHSPAMLEALEGRLVLSTYVKLDTTMGNIGLELDEVKAPITVANFLNYLAAGRFTNSIVHRAQTNFVVQTGGSKFTVTDTATGAGTVENIPSFAPIVREITGISNTQGTIAMARSSALSSATSSFFFNLEDNSDILDPAPGATTTTGGGYTAFGRVIYGWDVVLAIESLRQAIVPPFYLDPSDPQGLGGTPIQEGSAYVSGQTPVQTDLVIVRSAKLVDVDANRGVVGGGLAASYIVYRNPGTGLTEEYFYPGFVGVGNKPTVFIPPVAKDTWRLVDLTTAAGSPVSDESVQTWQDPVDDSSRAAVPTSEGLYVFYRNPLGGVWVASNLTTGLPGGRVITSEITVFRSIGENPLMHIAGLTSDNHLILYREVLQPLDPQSGRRPRSTWEVIDLTQDHLIPQGLQTPAFTGRLISYVTSWNGLNIAGLDSNGDIHTVWWAPGMSLFSTDNLSAITGAPKFTGGLAAYLTSWGGINLAGVQTNGDVAVTWWVPAFEGEWVSNNFTQEFGGPKLSADSLTTYVMNAWGGLNIVGIDSATNKMTIYWWAPGLDEWNVTPMDTISGYVAPVGRLAAATAPSGLTSIVGTSADGELMQYSWFPGGQWTTTNITFNSLFSTDRT